MTNWKCTTQRLLSATPAGFHCSAAELSNRVSRRASPPATFERYDVDETRTGGGVGARPLKQRAEEAPDEQRAAADGVRQRHPVRNAQEEHNDL